MTQENGKATGSKFIRASYRLYDATDGRNTLVEETSPDLPFTFISGLGFLLEAFERQLVPLSVGERFDFFLTPDEAYGEHDEERVVNLDKSLFTIDGQFDARHIRRGAVVPLADEEGRRFNGIVDEVSDDKVRIDLNHPLAGRTLRFEGEVLENHDASGEEISAFLSEMTGPDECDGKCKDKADGHCCGHHGEGSHGCGHHHGEGGHCRHHGGS